MQLRVNPVSNGYSNMLPIIDSHIHLYPSSDVRNLAWTADLPPDHCLNKQNSVEEYRAAARSSLLRGFVFVETDRKSGLEDQEWRHPLEEVEFLARIANGTPLQGEGFLPSDKDLVLGIIPWAPVPAGVSSLSRYMSLVKEHCDAKDISDKIKGVRYLVQRSHPGTMLQPDFVEGLKWLGKNNFTFDLGVDARSGGLYQMREACEMMERVYEGEVKLKIIINHLCKPNLHLSALEATAHPDFLDWKDSIQRMAEFPDTYMKLSGAFSELPPQEPNQPADIDNLVRHMKPWIEVVLNAFGPERIMFGSDWPVCNVQGPGTDLSWRHWHDTVTAILEAENLTDGEKSMIWSGTAAKAYNIT
jgi:L-rhamnono-1,4-lactonase